MRYNFEEYLPSDYDVLTNNPLRERLFPDKRTYLEYRYYKADCQRHYYSKFVEIEREMAKDYEYRVSQQVERGIEYIREKMKNEPYDERIDRLIGKGEN